MIKTNTILRAICTLAAFCALDATATAQSVLNFTPKGPAGITVTNTSAHAAADVKFTLYKPDGTLAATGLTNNLSYRIPPMGQLAMTTSEIFRMKTDSMGEGWIQVTSSQTGLEGYYFVGNFADTFDGVAAPAALAVQTIPYIAADPGARTTVLVTNPGTQSVDLEVSFFDRSGGIVASRTERLAPYQQVALNGVGVSARIASTSGPGLVATAIVEDNHSVMMFNGQSPDPGANRQVVPYFPNRRVNPFIFPEPTDFDSRLVLANPWPEAVVASVTFLTIAGERNHAQTITIPANGAELVRWNSLTGGGWLFVESPVALAGLAIVVNEFATTAVPLQSSSSDRMLLSRFSTQGFTSRLTLVGNAERDATLTVTLNNVDGTTAAQANLQLPRLSRISGTLNELLSPGGPLDGGFVTITSSAPVYSMGSISLGEESSVAVVTPQRLPASFPGKQGVRAPRIHAQLLDGTVAPGASFRISSDIALTGAVLWVGDQSVPMAIASPFDRDFYATLPTVLEPGVVSVKVRIGGLDSNTETLGIYSPNGLLTTGSPRLKGSVFFQKVDVTDNGLDLNQTTLVPVRNARVEVVDRVTQAIVSVSQTDEMGRFETPVPNLPGLRVQVLSRLRLQDLKVLNNSGGATLYSIARDFESVEGEIELIEATRNAGAFNILDTIQLGNALLATAGLVPPPLTVYWSESNNEGVLAALTDGAIRTTFFNPNTNAAYILGDRSSDSDEFDDSVILHEYAHMLAAKFSRDDSNGGPHLPGDSLDPRIAWSEGWANFFSSAARGTSLYRDSKADTVLRVDLEQNVPDGDRPGYWSEASVHGLLWDLLDNNADNGDEIQVPFASIWSAFTDLRLDRNVCLTHFLDDLLQRNPLIAGALRTMALVRSIDFQPGLQPSVGNPFPKTIAVGESKDGQVDSFTTKRTNLIGSSDVYSLSTLTPALTSIMLLVSNLGPANNPVANDLDLFLYDSTGHRIIAQSDGNLSGQNEIISAVLPAGTYFIEVRSFYVRGETGTTVFNSGGYRLSVRTF